MPSGRLLVLDDDPTVGLLVVIVAQSVGFDARLCEAPAAFFESVADWDPSHVAIDLNLPTLGGADVLRELARRSCPARVIIVSGAGRADIEAAADLSRTLGLATAGTLNKPFAVAALRALLAG